jgi:alanine-synthesizing transaminase
VLRGVERSKYLQVVPPRGALYAFIGVRRDRLPHFDDAKFAMALLEEKHVLVVPGSSFNVDYRDHFRVTLLPDEETLDEVFVRIESLLDDWAARPPAGASAP